MRIAAGIEYCGSGFHGWQRQKKRRNVQQNVEAALSTVADHPVIIHCAGRTDAGVHALHQVIHFDTSAEREIHSWVFGGNVNLPRDIGINWAIPVDEDFHARFSATARTYRYIILNRRSRPAVYNRLVTWEYQPLDEMLMAKAAMALVGEHDFTSYRAQACQAKSPVREIRKLEIARDGDIVIIEIEANAFLHHMVRNIAGVLMMIGMGKESVEWAKQVLDARDRTAGGVTAAPDGLYLIHISYPDKYPLPENKAKNWILPNRF